MTGVEQAIPANGFVTCDHCGQQHVAEYDHDGQWNQGPIFAVICDDGLTDYYTAEVVTQEIRVSSGSRTHVGELIADWRYRALCGTRGTFHATTNVVDCAKCKAARR